jgi:hypothetical protein
VPSFGPHLANVNEINGHHQQKAGEDRYVRKENQTKSSNLVRILFLPD